MKKKILNNKDLVEFYADTWAALDAYDKRPTLQSAMINERRSDFQELKDVLILLKK